MDSKKKSDRRFWWISGSICGLFLFVLLLPQIFSTPWGSSFLARAISTTMEGSIQVESASLRWRKGQKVSGLRWVERGAVLEVEQVTSTLSLWSLLWGGRDLGALTLDGPTLRIIPAPLAAERAVASPPAKRQKGKERFPFSVSFMSEGGTLSVISPLGEVTTLSNLTLGAEVPRSRDRITASLTGEGLSIQLQTDPDFSLQTTLTAFPVQTLDGLFTLISPLPPSFWSSLIGERLNLSLLINSSRFELAARGSNLEWSCRATIAHGVATLTEPALFRGRVTSEAFHWLTEPDISLQLAGPVDYRLSSSQLIVPLTAWQTSAGVVELATSPLSLSHIYLGPLAITSLRGSLERGQVGGPLKYGLNLLLVDEGVNGQLTLNGNYAPPSSELRVEASSLPTRWIAALLPVQDALLPLLGSRLTGSLVAQGSRDHVTATLAGSSTAFTLPPIQFSITPGQIELEGPLSLLYTPPKAASQALIPSLYHADPISIYLATLSLPRPFDWTEVRIEGEATTPLLQFVDLRHRTTLTLEKSQLLVGGERLGEAAVAASADVTPPWQRWLGDHLPFELKGKFNQGKEFRFEATSEAESLDLDLKGRVSREGVCTLTAPVQIHVRPPALEGIAVAAEVSPFAIDLHHPDFSRIDLTASALMEPAGAGIDTLDLILSWKGKKNLATLSLNGSTAEGSPLTGEATIGGLLAGDQISLTAASLKGKLSLTRFPTEWIDQLRGDSLIGKMVGPFATLNGSALLDQLSAPQGKAEWSLDSTLLQVQGSAKMGRLLTLGKLPIEWTWHANREAMEALWTLLKRAPLVRLTQPTTLLGRVSQLTWEWQPTPHFDPRVAGITAEFSLESGQIEIAKTLLDLAHLSCSIDAPQMSSQMSCKGSGAVGDGSFALDLLFNGLIRSNGSINWTGMGSQGRVHLDQFPTVALGWLGGERVQQLNALFGETIATTSSWSLNQLTGPIALSLQSTHSAAELHGGLKGGVLTLSRPFQGQVAVTPYLGAWLLGKLNPLLATAIGSERPLSLSIGSEGFQLPLLPYLPARVNVPSATVDLGKLFLANRGSVQSLLNLMGAGSSGPVVTAWFTPLPLSVHSGHMVLERMDGLIGSSFHMATWGEIDLVSRQVQLMLAIAPETIQAALRVETADYFLIPISGPMGATSIDWAAAGTQIASLAAKKIGGTPGKIGKIIDVIGGAKRQQQRIPPQPPLPWQ